MPKLYDIPLLYDLAFRRGAIGNHVDELIECHKRFRPDFQLQNVLELASGPSRHALEFVYRDYLATAVDNSQAMCAYASRLAQENSLTLDVQCKDMRDFAIDGHFDMAMIMLNSIGHIHSAEEFEAHLSAIWKHLNTDGLYVIEVHYPPWTSGESLKKSSWMIEMNEFRLQVDFGTPDDDFDLDKKIRKLALHVFGELRGEPVDFADHLILRSWSADALEASVRSTSLFEVVAKLGAIDPDNKFDPETAERLVYVLRKID